MSVNDYEWNFYAVNSHNKLVYGFRDEAEAKHYAGVNRYKMFSRGSIRNKKIDPAIATNWTDKYPETGLED